MNLLQLVYIKKYKLATFQNTSLHWLSFSELLLIKNVFNMAAISLTAAYFKEKISITKQKANGNTKAACLPFMILCQLVRPLQTSSASDGRTVRTTQREAADL